MFIGSRHYLQVLGLKRATSFDYCRNVMMENQVLSAWHKQHNSIPQRRRLADASKPYARQVHYVRSGFTRTDLVWDADRRMRHGSDERLMELGRSSFPLPLRKARNQFESRSRQLAGGWFFESVSETTSRR